MEHEAAILAAAKAIMREATQPFPEAWDRLSDQARDSYLRMGRAAWRAIHQKVAHV